MKISLILGTIGRVDELEKFFMSLCKQTYKDYEVILIDQNEDDRVKIVINKYQNKMLIKHLKSEKGLSKARNLGLAHATGDIIAFPDDDCWYAPSLFETVINKFQCAECDAITGCSEDGNKNISAGNFWPNNTVVDIHNVWRCAISFTMFIKSHCIRQVGNFDENIGVGAQTKYLSGEETDYMIRLIKANFKVCYFRDLIVYHPNPVLEFNKKTIERAYTYGCGCGYLLKKYRYPLSVKLYFLSRSLGGAIIALFAGKFGLAEFRWNSFKGRLEGMM